MLLYTNTLNILGFAHQIYRVYTKPGALVYISYYVAEHESFIYNMIY